MYYEINVSRNGRHFFATAERSLTTESEAKAAYMIFAAKFPESEGYKIEVTCWQKSGRKVDFGPAMDLIRLTGGNDGDFSYGAYLPESRQWLNDHKGEIVRSQRININYFEILGEDGAAYPVHLYDCQILR